jgi:hypothetical protein
MSKKTTEKEIKDFFHAMLEQSLFRPREFGPKFEWRLYSFPLQEITEGYDSPKQWEGTIGVQIPKRI